MVRPAVATNHHPWEMRIAPHTSFLPGGYSDQDAPFQTATPAAAMMTSSTPATHGQIRLAFSIAPEHRQHRPDPLGNARASERDWPPHPLSRSLLGRLHHHAPLPAHTMDTLRADLVPQTFVWFNTLACRCVPCVKPAFLVFPQSSLAQRLKLERGIALLIHSAGTVISPLLSCDCTASMSPRHRQSAPKTGFPPSTAADARLDCSHSHAQFHVDCTFALHQRHPARCRLQTHWAKRPSPGTFVPQCQPNASTP